MPLDLGDAYESFADLPCLLLSGYDNYEPKSSASSVYDGISRRRDSFESDRQSIAGSVYTISGAATGSGRSVYGGNGGPSTSGFFGPGVTALTPYSSNQGQPGGAWANQPRNRTSSSATQAAQAAYAPGSVANNAEWRQSIESMRQNGARSVAPTESGSRVVSSSAHLPLPGSSLTQSSSRKGPLVYPAQLSKVAKAFKEFVAVSERTKDGLSYKDAFDGREAVDRIAYIIKTTDRNLALLLGRALDAQKFFHDVTYDHRLRDSPNELYQFRVRLATPFGSDDDGMYHDAPTFYDAPQTLPVPGGSLAPSTSASSAASVASPGGLRDTPSPALTTTQAEISQRSSGAYIETEEDTFPTGVFTLLTDCYSPTCTRDRLCYSIACPRRLEQQARLNLKPQPGLKRTISKESLGETKESGALWAESVSKEVLESVSETERRRQELINEVVQTERDFVRDLEYLRDQWIKPLRTRDIVAADRRDDFVTQVFWNVLEVHAVNSKLCELLVKRQKQQAVVDRISDIFLEMVPLFQPFVKYGAHQLYGKYEFEKEKASNPAFAKFVDVSANHTLSALMIAEALSLSRKLKDCQSHENWSSMDT